MKFRYIRPKQEEFTPEAHPPPSVQYTRVIQQDERRKIRKYKDGELVWMWDTQNGEPTNVQGSKQTWLGPFKVRKESVNDSYYLSTLEGRRRHYLLVDVSSNPTLPGGT